MNIINLTPHPVVIIKETENIAFKSEGNVRLKQSTKVVSQVIGITITETEFGNTEGLPETSYVCSDCMYPYSECHCTQGCFSPCINTYYIVSRIVLTANPDRQDLLVPNEVVRDEKGNIVGCKSLARN